MSDISIEDYRAGVKTLMRKIGPKAETFASINMRDGAPTFGANVYIGGICSRHEMDFQVEANTLRDLLSALTNKWSEHEERHRARTIRKMALAIIRITAEFGACTDAALRNLAGIEFAAVVAYGQQACAEANEIAGKGPFTIIVMGGANAPAAAWR